MLQKKSFLPGTAKQIFDFALDHLNRNSSVCFINSEGFVLDHFNIKLNLPVLLQYDMRVIFQRLFFPDREAPSQISHKHKNIQSDQFCQIEIPWFLSVLLQIRL